MSNEFSNIKTLFDNAPIGLFLTTKKGQFVNLNDRFVHIMGYESVADVLDNIKNLSTDLYEHPRERDQVLETVYNQPSERPFYLNFKKKDRTLIPVRMYIHTYDAPDKDQHYLIGTIEDLSEQNSLQAKLDNLKKNYHTLFNSAGDAVFIQQGKNFLEYNRKAQELFALDDKKKQYSVIDISAQYQANGKPSPEKASEYINKVLNGEPQSFEWICKSKSGEFLICEISLSKLDSDIPNSFLAIIRDITAQKQANIILKASEERYRHLFNNAPIGIIRTNVHGEILLVNSKMAQILGYQNTEEFLSIVQSKKQLYASKNDKQKQLEILRRQGAINTETKLLRKDQKQINAHLIATTEKDVDGQILHITTFVEDLSEKQKLKNKLHTREETLKSIIDSLPFELIVTNFQNNVILQNATAKKTWGDYQNKDILTGDIPEHSKRQWKKANKKIQKGKTYDTEEAVLNNGKKFHLRRILSPLKIDDKPTGIVSISIDITERVKLEQKVRQNESLLRTIISSIPNELWVVDKHKKILMQSDFSINRWGSYIGKYVSNFQQDYPDSYAKETDLNKILTGGIIDTVEKVTVYGKPSYGRRIIVPFYNKNEIDGYISLSFDITELKSLQLELEQHRDNLELLIMQRTEEVQVLNEELIASNDELRLANETLTEQRNKLQETLTKLRETQEQLIMSEKMASLGVLTAGVAHEINNPVNFISSGIKGLEMLMQELTQQLNHCLDLSEEESESSSHRNIKHCPSGKHLNTILQDIPKLINAINQGVTRTTNIVRGLRTFSRLDSSKKRKADIQQLIDSTLTILQNKTKNRITIEKHYDDIAPFLCYPGKLSQVFLNILSNSIQAIPDKGKITITTKLSPLKNKIIIFFADNGIGIPKKIRHKIFDPFFTTKEVGEGTGLGLSITHAIIKEHNGSIDLTSEKNMGTEFIIKLPINE